MVFGGDGDASEDYLDWYDIIEAVYNGRKDGHHCPFCHDGIVQVEAEKGTERIHLQCQSCGKFVEVRTKF